MSATLRTRKPVHELKASDFRVFPVWEYAMDEEDKPGRDETWVRPVDSKYVPKGAYSQIVGAQFTTASGRKLNGFMEVTTADGKADVFGGVILGRLGYVSVPRVSRKLAERQRNEWAIRARDEFIRAIREPESKVFPI